MPVRIDQMETTVELTSPDSPAREGASSRTGEASPSGTALSQLIGRVMADELDQFLRNRGMSR